MKSVLIFCVSISLFCSCNRKVENGIFQFDLAQNFEKTEHFVLSEFASSISYLPLEKTTDCIIGNVQEIIPAGNKLIITTTDYKIFVFDLDGRYSNKIGTIGKGPGEFVTFRKVFWDGDSQKVIVFNMPGSSLMFYSLEGYYIESFELPIKAMDAYRMPDGRFLAINSYPTPVKNVYSNYFLFDLSGEVTPLMATEKIGEIQRPMIYHPTYCNQIDDIVYIVRPRSDTLLIYKDGVFKPYASFNLGKMIAPDNVFYNHNIRPQDLDEYVHFGGILPLTDNEFIYRVNYNRKSKFFVCNIKTGQSLQIKLDEKIRGGITNDIDNGYTFKMTQNLYNHTYYSALSPSILVQLLQKGSFKEAKPKFQELLNGIDEDDNPIIAMYKLK